MTAASTAASSLPPVRTSCHVPLSLMTSISEETIALWLKLGALEKLEQAVLDGYGDQLCGKTSRIPQVNKFLKQVPQFQNKIREIHLAVSQGRLRDVQHLIDRKKLAFCRDHNGASPLHKAVIFGHQDVIEYLVRRYGGVIHIRDHQGRTALHYAAFLPDRGEIYQYLLALGADERAMDVYGRQPSYYLDGQNESTLRQLRDGSSLNGIRKIKPRYYGQVSTGQTFPNANKSTVSKSQIRELISEGNISALEELVLQGQGDRLLGETSTIPKLQSFLNIVPMYMERIYDVHRAVMRDQLEHVVILLENRKLALARDQLGATPLHKSIWFGHYKIAHYISNQFPETLNALDMEGRTALHYAAALKDNKNMYGILIEAGANKGIYDNKGKLPDYYSQYPEHLNLEEVIKRCHKVNANYLANTASRIKGKSPVRQTPPPSNENLSSPRSEENNVSSKENSQSNESGNENIELISLLQKEKLSKRVDINSANIRRWVSSKDMEKLTKAVMEGYGEKVVKVHTTDESEDKDEIGHKITEMVDRVNAIHTAVSSDDLNELQNQLDEKDYALAKDHMGMTPLHKAVLLRKPKIVQFLIEKFPETINAKNKTGLTALHYASAMSRKDGQQLYKMLLQAGADPKIRDNHGRTPDYYKTHLITMPNKGIMKNRPAGGRGTETLNRFSRHGVLERMTAALQRGDVELLQELVLEGHGKHLLGKTSWHDDVKNFLKELPLYLNSIQSFRESIKSNDLEQLKTILSKNENLMRAKDESGAFPIHLAASVGSSDVLEHFAKNYPTHLNIKDSGGRTALHIVSQKGNHTLHKLLKEAGANSKILDLKGRSADFYLQSHKSDMKINGDIYKISPNTSSDSMYSNSSSEGKYKKSSKYTRRKNSIFFQNAKNKTGVVSEVSEDTDLQVNPESRENETESGEVRESRESSNDDLDDSANCSEDKLSDSDEKDAIEEEETNESLHNDIKEENDEDAGVEADLIESNEDETAVEEVETQTQEEESVDETTANELSADPIENPEKEKEDIETTEDNVAESDDVKEPEEKSENATEIDGNEEENKGEDDNEGKEDDSENTKDSEEDKVEDSENVAENQDEEKDESVEIDKDENEAEDVVGNVESNEEEAEVQTEETAENVVQTGNDEEENIDKPADTEVEEHENIEENADEDSIPEESTEASSKSFEVITVAEVGSGNPDNAENIEESEEKEDESKDGEENNEDEEPKVEEEHKEDEETKDEEEHKEDEETKDEEENNADTENKDIHENIEANEDKNEEQEASNEETIDQTCSAKEENENMENNDTDNVVNENTTEGETAPDTQEITEDVLEENPPENQEEVENTPSEEKEENEKIEENEATEENNELDTNNDSEAKDIKEEENTKEEEHKEEPNVDLQSNENTDEQSENATETEQNNSETTDKNPREGSHQTKDHLDELIEHWIKEGDLLRLEHVVLAGQGDRLIERMSDDKQVQDFLDLVPIYMAKIRAVHEAVAKGQLREVRSVLTRKRFALSRDHVGASPLHLAVLHGHTDVSAYIISHFPETMDGPDNEGRTPLHYASALPDNGTLYRLLKSAGADENIEDKAGHNAKYYLTHPNTLALGKLLEPYAKHE